ncbi:RNA polymerase sigma factor [Vitiosangium sp. GDMCC 1.1324]|uniref:RNA polymerase sigma factor n=1 Tax=Vitiosangium sp. (strain GDMCC 1.1324) TaxID=2138576 RepID=UPI001E620411|nr:sigma-70 family RNA polymerase sigma factor [Vitiosangium sp. GDMCC 1.1324]
MSLLQDRAILDAFRRGEKTVLTQVYLRCSDEVARFLAGGVGVRLGSGPQRARLRPLDVEAAHQETFIRAFRPEARLAYDGLRPYLPYLLRIAHSTAVDLLRSAGKISREAIPLEEAPELFQVPDEAPSPERDALDSELRAVVRKFLDRLSPNERALAQLRFMEGLSQELVAERLSFTRYEVRTCERHLRDSLERHLRGSGWLDAEAPRASSPSR